APPPTALPTLSLHDALPIWKRAGGALEFKIAIVVEAHPHHAENLRRKARKPRIARCARFASGRKSKSSPSCARGGAGAKDLLHRSEEHTSELQSRFDLVCRL